jgi:hypothetical protein
MIRRILHLVDRIVSDANRMISQAAEEAAPGPRGD